MAESIEKQMEPIYQIIQDYLYEDDDKGTLGRVADLSVRFEMVATQDQVDDLLGFLHWSKMQEKRIGWICSNLIHDLSGIANQTLGFQPRTAGYAKELENMPKNVIEGDFDGKI